VATSYTQQLKLRQPARGDDLWDTGINLNASVLELALTPILRRCGVISGLEVSAGSGLSANYSAGSARIAGTLRTINAGTKTCSDNAANLIHVDSSGQVQVSTALPPEDNYAALAIVECEGGVIVRVADLRHLTLDYEKEHAQDGSHGLITPTRIDPRGTLPAYLPSGNTGWQADPTAYLNNVIIKPDPTIILNRTNVSTGGPYDLNMRTAGSGWVPAKANAVILEVVACDSSGNAATVTICRKGETNPNILMVNRVHARGSGGLNYWYHNKLFVPLDANGYVQHDCVSGGPNTLTYLVTLAGWIETA